jgi:hypothetical protein
MITRLRYRALALPAIACALVAATALIVTAVGRADDRAARDEAAQPAMIRVAHGMATGDVWSPRARGERDDVITVRGRKCPKSHPHKVGSSARRWTRIDDGEVKHGSRRSVICAR